MQLRALGSQDGERAGKGARVGNLGAATPFTATSYKSETQKQEWAMRLTA